VSMPRSIRSRASVRSRTSLTAITIPFQSGFRSGGAALGEALDSDSVMIIGSSRSRDLRAQPIFGHPLTAMISPSA
jgi:hypothetical protein